MTNQERDEIQKLLREIRDTQREHLAEYRQVTQRSLELQQRAVARQEQIAASRDRSFWPEGSWCSRSWLCSSTSS
jgi:hypothetical protein